MPADLRAAPLSVELRVPSRCLLGEGVCWDARTGSVTWVDIHGKQVWQWHLATGATRQWAAPQRVGWLIRPAQGQTWLAGLQEGVAEVQLQDTGSVAVLRWLARPFTHNPALRLNDAKADALGQIWAGSLNNDDESRPEGALYCLRTDGEFTTVDTGYGVANGPAISPDGSLMLHTDSARRTIYAFDLSPTGAATHKRVWKVLAEGEGYPDGMNFDAQGHLWLAHWGAGMVSRFDVEGRLLRRVHLPASQVTNVAFCGEQLDRLMVTTARVGLSPDQLAQEPEAGSLFEITGHGAQGLLPQVYGGA